jgi:hypothetical protein
MISLIDKHNKLNEHKNTLFVTYPRTVEIIFGNFPYPDKIHNLIIEIKNNLKEDMKNYTNVKGGMTDWNYFIDKPSFKEFIDYVINKNQLVHPNLFKHFYSKNMIHDAWGNEIKSNDYVKYHTHESFHGILYLTEGCDLNLPDLNLKITPQPGDYYIFPPQILHGFEPSERKETRYSLVFNLEQNPDLRFKYEKNTEPKNS